MTHYGRSLAGDLLSQVTGRTTRPGTAVVPARSGATERLPAEAHAVA